MKFTLISIIWGKQYINLFLEYVIPNYLSENNIPSASKKFDISIHIYTTVQDAVIIEQHPHFQKLASFIKTEFFPVIDNSIQKGKNKWSMKGYCQSLAIKEAIKTQSVVLLFNPDTIIADGGIEKCCQLIAQGNKTILVAELARTETESAILDLDKYYDKKTNSVSISNRQLMGLGIRHLHQIGKLCFWKCYPFTKFPSLAYWKAGQQSLLAKFFHLHPLAIDLREIHCDLPEVLMPDDGGLIEYLGISESQTYVVTDSNEIACVELSSKMMDPLDSLPGYPSSHALFLVKWAWKHTLNSHRYRFRKLCFRFQGEEDIQWETVEQQVSRELLFPHLTLSLINFSRTCAEKLGIVYLKRKVWKLLKN